MVGNKYLKIYAWLLFLVIAPLTVLADIENFEVTVSPTSGYADESYTMRVVIEGVQEAPYPNLIGGDDFDVEIVGPSSSVQIVNGNVSASLAYLYRLTPKKSGTLPTPSAELEYNGKKYTANGPLVKVSPAKQVKNTSRGIFAQQTISKKSVWQGEQVSSVLELYSKVRVLDGRIGAVNYKGFWKKTFNNQTSSTKYVKGEQYKITRVPTYLFPVESGELEIPEQAITVKAKFPSKRRRQQRSRNGLLWDPFGGSSLFDDFFDNNVKSLVVKAPAKKLTVKALPPRPKGFPDWGLLNTIVGDTKVNTIVRNNELSVGESATITVVIRSAGNLSPIKTIPFETNDRFKIYTEDPKEEYTEAQGHLVSKKTLTLSLIPLQSGEITLPLNLGYFDPDTAAFKVFESKPIVLKVTGNSPSSPVSTQPTPTSEESLKYVEPGFLEKLAEQISIGFALFVAVIALLLICFSVFVVRLARKRQRRRFVERELDQAKNLPELKRSLIEFLAFHHSSDSLTIDGMTTEELKRSIEKWISDENLTFRLHQLLDRIEFGLYSKEGLSTGDFRELQEELVKTVRRQYR